MHILGDRPLFSQLLFLSPQLSVFSPKILIRKALPSWFLSFSSSLTAPPTALDISHHFRPTTLLFHVQPKVSIPTTVMARWWYFWPYVPCSLAPPKTSPHSKNKPTTLPRFEKKPMVQEGSTITLIEK